MDRARSSIGWVTVGCVTLGLVSGTGCLSPYYTDRGAGVGALGGGLAGAAIGHHNGNTAGGALLGTALGALGGAVVGSVMDQEIARNTAVIEERMGRRLSGAVTTSDVVAMTRAGVGDEVITSHINANGVAQRPSAGDVISLHNQGVSERVINAMQNAGAPRVAAGPPPPMPVIVEEHYLAPYPPPPPYWHRRHYHHPPPCGPGVSWGVSVSH